MWNALEPHRPIAQAIAGTQESQRVWGHRPAVDSEGPAAAACMSRWDTGRSNRASTSHPTPNAIVRHSNAGISSDQSASAGHVDHRGIANAPKHVQARGDKTRAPPGRDLNRPNQSVAA